MIIVQKGDLERKQVDAEIAVLEERIRQLKIKRNTLSPIYALPNELLCRMFLECRGQWMQIDDKGCPTWTAVTQVCDVWRTAALEYPQLWSGIDPDMNLYWMKTFISRAKGASLSLRISQKLDVKFSNEKLRLLSGILRDQQRLERVIIEMRGDELHGLLTNLTERMPNLIHFGLHKPLSDDFQLPSPLFDDYAPRLQTLSLVNFDPPWTSPVMEGLTSLSVLKTNDFCYIPSPSFNTFFRALSKMPSLQYLAIENILPNPDPSDPYISALHLPSLHSLKLQGRCEQCSLVVRHIQLPKSANVKLRVFDADESHLKELFEVLDSSWQGGPLSKAESPAGVTECDSISLFGATLGISLSIGQSTGPTRFELDVINKQWTRSHHSLLMNLIPPKNLTSLSMIQSSLGPAVLKITLPQLPSVTKLSVSSSPVSTYNIFKVFLEDLATKDVSGTSERSSPTIYLPQLTELYISHIHFTRDSDRTRKAYGLRLGDLKRWLRFRHASGASIKLLRIFDCSNMTSATESTLQDCIGVGGRVVWDGIVRQ
ncbi:hypothetical protein BKA70DRAFT_1291622 [Coprinopsis sp. MPI-PUGE-AT-0042]|nr:hypothetical protein BKA70DRAFT_1291622 [Coprinopsis sp. MPI-PUGE-AT-0042]